MEWIKPVGVSKYHLFEEGITLCERSYHLEGREIIDETPNEELKCEECKLFQKNK